MISDLELQRDVLDELEFEPSINAAHIGVTANKGIVTLTGFVTDDWRWQLWLEGYPIDIDRWLGAKLDALVNVLAPIKDLDAVEATLCNPKKPQQGSAGALVNGRVRSKPARDSLMSWALSVASGVTPAAQLGDPDPKLFDILKQTVGLAGLWPLPDSEVNPENLTLSILRNCVADARPTEVEQARLDWTIITELAEILETSDPALPVSQFLLLLWRDFTARTIMLAFLIFIRRSPDHSRNLSLILRTAHAALHQFASKAAEPAEIHLADLGSAR